MTESCLIKAYVLPGAPDDVDRWIRPARPARDWMDRTPARYAYRCTPLSAANTMGWEILNPVNCEFRWNGLTPHQQTFVYSEEEHRFAPRSHFGSGVVTWDLPFLFRTPPEWGMAVTGPGNHDHPHVTPLDGFIRTDWLPFPFTMNWRITAPDQTVRFQKGEPIARIFPYPLALLDEARIEIHDLDEDPEFRDQFEQWAEQRKQNYQRRDSSSAEAARGGEPDRDDWWNRQYAHGSGSGDAEHQHQTVFRCKKVEDHRTGRPTDPEED